jgi:hypothetical protein
MSLIPSTEKERKEGKKEGREGGMKRVREKKKRETLHILRCFTR